MFVYEVLHFTHLGSYGYAVYEVCNGVRWLRIISGGHWGDPMLAGLHAICDTDRLKNVSKRHNKELVAA